MEQPIDATCIRHRRTVRGQAALALLLVLTATCTLPAAHAGPGELAATPPMGWNSWDAYGLTIDEADFKANAAVLASLAGNGWRHAVIDEGWYMRDPFGKDLASRDYQLDRHGRLVPAVERFPSARRSAGLRPLADWTHSQGLKFGIHILRGIPKAAATGNGRIEGSRYRLADAADVEATCPWDDGNFGILDNAAGQAYYDSLFRLYAAWHVDFVKVDCIADHPYRPTEIRQIAAAIARAGRPMVLSLSPGPTDPAHAVEVARYAHMWRISDDIWDGWTFEHDTPGSNFPAGVVTAFDNLAQWAPHAGPGHWPDADMLPFGSLAPHPGWGQPRVSRLTRDEQQTQFVLWSIARSPLILGGNLTELDPYTRSLLENKALIELNQGNWRAHPVAVLPPELPEARAWVAEPATGNASDRVVALFNLGSSPATWRVSWRSLGLEPPRTAVVDLLKGGQLAPGDTIEVQVAAHGSVVYRLH